MTWVTEKETTAGLWRAEVQQIVPAPLSQSQYARLCEAGMLMTQMCGCPVASGRHMELMLLGDVAANTTDLTRVGAIEPNLRPAGMKIWDLAEIAFGLSPWLEWLGWAIGRPVTTHAMTRKCFAGIRMIPAPADGVFQGVADAHVEAIKAANPSVIEIAITAQRGLRVRTTPRDNAEFVGHVLAKHPDPEVLRTTLRWACDTISQKSEVSQ